MAFNSIGDLASNLLLSQANSRAKNSLSQLSTELTSGLTSDIHGRLQNDRMKQVDWEHTISTNLNLDKTLKEALTKVRAKQVAISAISGSSISLANKINTALSANAHTGLRTLQYEARDGLSQALSHLNTQVMGQNLFSGSAVDQPAMAEAENIIVSVKAYLGDTSGSATNVMQGVRNWMDAPVNGYQDIAYLGSTKPASSIRLLNDRSIDDATKADSPPLKAIVESFILATLSVDEDLLPLQSQRITLLQASSDGMRSANGDLISLQANLGFIEAEVTKSKVAAKAERHSYELLRSETLGIDEFEVASKLQAAELQLEKVYALTARSSRMSLLEYLR